MQHTGSGLSWWELDLGADKRFAQVVIWNRTDCCFSRLSDFAVTIRDAADNPVFEEAFSDVAWNSSDLVSLAIPLPKGTEGRYVRVQLTRPDYLHMAEVQVLTPVPAALPLLASALGGIAWLRRRAAGRRA